MASRLSDGETFELGGALEVRRIGLGTNRIDDDEQSRTVLAAAMRLGVNFIDTADIYTAGVSETVVGEVLGGDERAVIATKGGYHGASPEKIEQAIERSRARLRRDVIDLYYLHRPDPTVLFERSLEPIIAARDAGRIRHIGISNVSLTQVKSARLMTEIAAVQNGWSLDETDDGGVIDYCGEHGVAFVPYYPLRGSKRAEALAERIGATRHQAALAALLARSPVVTPIPGTRSPAHLESNLGAFGAEVDRSDLVALGLAPG